MIFFTHSPSVASDPSYESLINERSLGFSLYKKADYKFKPTVLQKTLRLPHFQQWAYLRGLRVQTPPKWIFTVEKPKLYENRTKFSAKPQKLFLTTILISKLINQ